MGRRDQGPSPNVYPDDMKPYSTGRIRAPESIVDALFDQEPEEPEAPAWRGTFLGTSPKRRRPKTMPWRGPGQWSFWTWHVTRRRLRDAAQTAAGKAMRAERRSGQ